MQIDYSINEYIELLRTQVALCSSLNDYEVTLPYKQANEQLFIICRSRSDVDNTLFKESPEAGTPIDLSRNGQVDLYLRLHRLDKNKIEIQNYRLAAFGIPDNDNKISSIRYDYTSNIDAESKKPTWDDDLGDNPQHPMSHLHINFKQENNCRFAVGQVSPILVLRAFDHWYYETFIKT